MVSLPSPSRWLQALESAVPSRCAVCGAWPAQPVCGGCLAQFGRARHRCRTCALPMPGDAPVCGACLRQPPPLEACFAAVDYAYPWAGLVARFKFQDEPGWAAAFGELLRAVPGLVSAIDRCDALVPMPLAPTRLQQRGFNQALQLARALNAAKVDAGLVLRLRETAAQADLDRAARAANVRGAFGIEPLRQPEVRGRHYLLVDDVMTSGASLHTAALALRSAGAASVQAVVLARTEEPGG